MFAHERSLVQRYQDRPFVLLGVNADPKLDTLKKAQGKYELNWRSWWDGAEGPIALQWKVRGFPTLHLIDHRGKVRWSQEGAPDLTRMDELIERLVQEAEADGSRQAALSRPRR